MVIDRKRHVVFLRNLVLSQYWLVSVSFSDSRTQEIPVQISPRFMCLERSPVLSNSSKEKSAFVDFELVSVELHSNEGEKLEASLTHNTGTLDCKSLTERPQYELNSSKIAT